MSTNSNEKTAQQGNDEKNLLPFAVYADKNKNIVTSENEAAAVFCLSEMNRYKGGGFLKRKNPETTVFLTKVYYPFWLATIKESNAIFDGLNVSSYSINYPTIPDINVFKNNLDEYSSTRQVYSSFLSNHATYFEKAQGEKTQQIEGLIADADFLKEFIDYLEKVIKKTQVTDGILISPTFNLTQIKSNIKNIEKSSDEFTQQVKKLREIIKLLSSKTQEVKAGLKEEIKKIDDKYAKTIEDETKKVEKTKSELNKEYSEKVTEASGKFEREAIDLNETIIRFEKAVNEANSEIEQIDLEIKKAQIDRDEQIEQQLKEKRNELKRQLPNLALNIKSNKEKIKVLEANKKNELFVLQKEHEAKVKDALVGLHQIETTKDAEKKILVDEFEKIEEATLKITGDIDFLLKTLEQTSEVYRISKTKQGQVATMLVYMPFYVIGYLSKSDKRFIYLPPSVVSDIDMGVKLKSFGRKKIAQFLQPRSQKIVSILNKFIKMLNEDIVFRHEITEACGKGNLLQSKDSIEKIIEGLNDLKNDRWISEEEFKEYSDALAKI